MPSVTFASAIFRRGTITLVLAATLLTALSACGQDLPLDKPLNQRKRLVVLATNSPMTYYTDREGKPDGYEYRLTQALGKSLHLKIEYRVVGSLAKLLKALRDGEGDLAAANLTATPDRKAAYLMSPAYDTVTEQVVCRRDGPIPDDISKLPQVSILVPKGSSYVETLKHLRQKMPDLKWTEQRDGGAESALEDIVNGRANCTLSDSNIVAVNRRYYPELDVAFSLPGDKQLVWLLPQKQRPLADYLAKWIPEARQQGILAALDERYYSYIPVFDFVDARELKRRLKTRLDDLWGHFEEAAETYRLPPGLLAAIAYQESHWDADAQSPTGVRGVMMLTQSTAQRVGVDDRSDARHSILGGAKYFRDLYDRLPNGIPQDERYWFALAAYNIGMAHLYDARRLAARRGLDKNRWRDVRKVLPLLGHEDVYKTLKHGFARGNETVRYVRRVRNYWDVIRLSMSKN